ARRRSPRPPATFPWRAPRRPGRSPRSGRIAECGGNGSGAGRSRAWTFPRGQVEPDVVADQLDISERYLWACFSPRSEPPSIVVLWVVTVSLSVAFVRSRSLRPLAQP